MKKIKLVIISAIIQCVFLTGIVAQFQQKPLQITLGSVKTDLGESAVQYAIRYMKSLDSIWEKQDFLYTGDKSLFLLTPEFDVLSGNEDAFSAINVKLTGLAIVFSTTEIAGIVTPNSAKIFHTFPLSAGIETNHHFNALNGLLEAGWVPWYQNVNRQKMGWIKKTKAGVFLQGGYKFAVDTTVMLKGGALDESEEGINDFFFRVKGSWGVDTRSLFQISGVGVGLVGDGNLWYDVINKAFYHSISGKLRFYLAANEDRYFDFHYKNGSGAPNFNKGDQYGLSLTVSF